MAEPEIKDIPEDIERILSYIAQYAKGYNNHLKWNEVAKLKSDMMINMNRWRLVSSQQIARHLTELGMRDEDVAEVADIHARRMQGRRVVPQGSYKGFQFRHDLRESE